ncbi:MAG TPA: sulfotransferase domain-containing protein [Solirubrobacterales bacterium]
MSLDFLVIGAPKSGTTSLFEYLRDHPEIDLPPDKEAPYFSDDRIVGRLSWEEYLQRAFPAGGRSRLMGTITPHYMSPITGVAEGPDGRLPTYDEHTLPRRIHERLPSARLIAILRDPVERAYSHHIQETRLGHETRPFPVAVDELLRPEALADSRRQSTRTNCYVVLGEYGRLLSAYYDLFPHERILVLFTEELAREPRAVLERIYEFLAVDAVEPRNLGRRYNVSAAEPKIARVSPASAVRLASANRVARAAWHSLSTRRRSALLAWYKRLDFRFKSWNRRPAPAAEPSAADVAALERLRAHYAPDALLLAELLDYPLPWAPGEAADSPEAMRK